MILKKPYAFLIKHFKIIHLFISAVMIYVIFKTNDILTFMNEYVASGYYNTISQSANSIVTLLLFIAIIFIVIASTIILILMKRKKKPIKVYIFNIISCVIFFIMNVVLLVTLQTLELETMELRLLRIIRDLYWLFSFVTYPILIFALIRGLGFDIKKFNFGEDIEQLQIDVADSEEFEVNLNIDPDLIKRKARKQRREFGYFLKENKGSLIIVGASILFLTTMTFVMQLLFYNPYYKEDQVFNVYNVLLTVTDTYLTNKDYKGKSLGNEDETYVVVKFQAVNHNEYNTYLTSNHFNLLVGDKRYEPITILNKQLFDLGQVYQNDILVVGKENYYTMVFKIPNKDITQKMIFRYRESISFKLSSFTATYKQVELTPKGVDQNKDGGTYKIGDTIDFKNSILDNSSLKINSVKVKDKFTHSFKYCVSETLCTDTKIDITPNPLASYDKTIIELDMDLSLASTSLLTYAKTKYDFIDNLAVIKYKVDGKEKYHTTPLENRTPKYNYSGNAIYIEVLDEMRKATNIELILNIRGIKYTYVLK